MKILHFADIHLDPSTSENVPNAMAQILALAIEEAPDLIVNCGDLSMKRGYLAPWVAEALREWHCELAKIAPVVVVAGNHDMTYDWERAGTLRGALSASREDGRIYLAERPCVFVPDTMAGPIAVACLPYPSKFALQATNGHIAATEINERLSQGLAQVAHGLALEAEQHATGRPSILVYHGSIRGAKTGTEQTMGTEVDPVLEERDIPDTFGAVLCGHIHKPQTLGRAVYAGSPCPLNFGEENHEHGVVIWEFGGYDGAASSEPRENRPGARDPGDVLASERTASRAEGVDVAVPAAIGLAGSVPGEPTFRFVALDPKHRLLTIDLRGEDDPIAAFHARELGPIRGARLRIQVRLPRGMQIEPVAARLEGLARDRGAFDCRLQVERDTEDRSAAPGQLRAEAALEVLLDAYAARNPEVAPHLDDLKALGAEIDGGLPPEVKALERIADYRLGALRWSNWKSFAEKAGEILVAGLGRLVCIEGENASGKSNLMEIESFALWGRLPRGKQPIGELVRLGAREAWVEVEFEADGREWRVRRAVSVNTKGDGKGLLTLQRIGQLGWSPANAGDARETQTLIEQLVGPFELYLATRFASQGDIDRLLGMTGAELKDTIQAALGTGIFEHREAAAKALSSNHDRKAATLHGQAAALTEQAGAIDTWLSTLAEHEGELGIALMQKTAAEAGVTEASEQLDRARQDMAAASERARRREDKETGLVGARALIRQCEAQRPALQQAIEAGSIATHAMEEHRARSEELVGLSAEESAHLSRTAQHRDLGARLSLRTHRETEEQARRARERAAVLRERQQLLDLIERDEKTASMIGKTPFGEACAERACSLLRLPIEARSNLDMLRMKVSEASTRTTHLERVHAGEVSASQAEIDALHAELEKVSAEIRASQEAGERIVQLRARVTGFDQAAQQRIVQAADRARGTLESLDQQQPILETQVQTYEAELAELPAVDLISLKVSEQSAVYNLTLSKATREAAAEAEKRADAKIAGIQARIEATKEALEKAKTIAAEADLEFQAAQLAGIFARAMGRDGVPYLMLERALPALEAHANGFLTNDDLRLEIEPARDLRSGEQRSEVHVRYRDGFGLHQLAAASGYQRMVLGYAFRAALAQTQAEAHGLQVSHWIADEGWSAASENNLLACQRMLGRIADRFARVFFVSHQSEIREVADTKIRVVKDPRNGSRIELDSPACAEVAA